MTQILRQPERWERHFHQMEDVDELKPPQLAENVLLMVEATTERYIHLQSTRDKLEMFEVVQEEALMRYCKELETQFLQLADAEVLSSYLLTSLARLANASNYVSLILRDWSERVELLHMQYVRESNDSLVDISIDEFPLDEVQGALFDAPIGSCDRVLKKSLRGLSSAISRSFQSNAQGYFNHRYELPCLG